MQRCLQVAVCDDDTLFCEELRTQVGAALTQQGAQAEIALFDGVQALRSHMGEIHLAFLDIELGTEESGFDAARLLAAKHPDALVVFVTRHDSYMKKSFAVHPFGYINKGQLAAELPDVLRDAVETLGTHAGIYVEELQGFLRTRDVVYARAERNYTCVHMADGKTHTTRMPLKDWQAHLGPAFFRCHKSYIVNLSHAVRLEGDRLLLAAGGEIPCARRQKSIFTAALAAYVARHGRYL